MLHACSEPNWKMYGTNIVDNQMFAKEAGVLHEETLRQSLDDADQEDSDKEPPKVSFATINY